MPLSTPAGLWFFTWKGNASVASGLRVSSPPPSAPPFAADAVACVTTADDVFAWGVSFWNIFFFADCLPMVYPAFFSSDTSSDEPTEVGFAWSSDSAETAAHNATSTSARRV